MSEEACKMTPHTWRVYRLPGSKEWWLIDHGPGSIVMQAKKIDFRVRCQSISVPDQTPRAWLEADGVLYIDAEDAAIFVEGCEEHSGIT